MRVTAFFEIDVDGLGERGARQPPLQGLEFEMFQLDCIL